MTESRVDVPSPSRMSLVQQPIIPIVGELIRSTPGTISLGQGMVSWGPPPEAIAAAREALEDPAIHRYGAVEGEQWLLDAIRRKLGEENRLDLSGSRVLVTAGSNMAFQSLVQAITVPGDEIVLPAPYYFNHEMAVGIAGCVPVVVATDASYQLDIDALARAITPRTRAIVTVSPNNPSGAVYSREALQAVNALCARRGIYHVSDEAYEYFTYPGASHYSPGSAPGASAHTISLYSLSKAFGFAGWRIGYMVVPGALNEAIYKVQDTVLICPALVAQRAAAAAIGVGRGWCDRFLPGLASVRDAVLARFREIEEICDVPSPGGAFYCLPRIHTTTPAMTIVERLVREHHVAAIPGDTFGLGTGGSGAGTPAARGGRCASCYLRISYGALDADTVEEGMARLVGGLRAQVR